MSEVIRLGTQARRLDVALIEQGERVEAPMAPGVFFTVLPWGDQNRRFRRALRARAMKEGLRGKSDAPEGEELHDYLSDLTEDPAFVVDAVLLDVEGLVDGEGEPLEYTRDRILGVLKDPGFSHVLSWLVGVALRLAGRYVEDTVAVGNSSRSASSGKRAGAARSAKTKN